MRFLKLPVVYLAIIFAIIGLLLTLYIYFNWQTTNTTLDISEKTESGADATSDHKTLLTKDDPFEILTIPKLRERDYTGSIKSIKKTGENSSYTTYIATFISDSLDINGLLTVPKGSEPVTGWPAIVFVHGYIPPSIYRTDKNYVTYVDTLSKSGFAVFKIDLRGHDKSQGEPTGAYYSSDYVIDTLNAYSALQNNRLKAFGINIDPGKIGLWGHSMGGNVVFRSVVVKKDIPAAVIWAGAGYTYSDLQNFKIQDNSYRPLPSGTVSSKRRQLLFDAHGSFTPESNFWKNVVPTNFLDGVTTSIQLNHAINDKVVNIEYSRNLHSILVKTSINHELKEYSLGGHNITTPFYSQAMQNTIRFYMENL